MSQWKVGEACADTWFMLFAVGSMTITEAAKKGGISKIEVVEDTRMGIPIIKETKCVKVYGR